MLISTTICCTKLQFCRLVVYDERRFMFAAVVRFRPCIISNLLRIKVAGIMKLLLRAYVHPNWHVSAQLKHNIYSLDVNIKSVC